MLRPGHAVAICVLALLTIGVVMVNSAGMSIHAKEPVSFDGIILSRTTVYAGLAMIALLACSVLPVRRLAAAVGHGADQSEGGIDEPILSPAWMRGVVREYVRLWPAWLGVFGLLVLLGSVYVPGIRSPKNGSHRWINLHVPGLESVQPSELAKWGLVLLMAWYAARWSSRMKSFWLGLVPGLAMIGVVAGFVVIEDLGTGALMAAAATVVLIAAGARVWQLLILCPLPAAGAVLAIITNPYRMHRIESFMNPYLDPQGKGFHMIQSMVSVANGQVFGRGLGGGLQKFGYLPEDTTDFIFANICEELGVAGAAIVLFLLGALVWSVWGIVRRERIPMLKLIGLGIMATVGVQAVINLAVVTGLGPTKGIALPLISSGGTGWILTAAALGLVVAMDRAQHLGVSRPESLPDEPRDEPDGFAIPALRVVAVSAAAATATLTEIKTSAGAESRESVEVVRETQSPEAVEVAAPPEEPETVEFAFTSSPVVESPAAPAETESVESMFAGLVVADVPAHLTRMEENARMEEAAAASAPIEQPLVEPTVEPVVEQVVEPKLDVIPGAPGKTGLLFDLTAARRAGHTAGRCPGDPRNRGDRRGEELARSHGRRIRRVSRGADDQSSAKALHASNGPMLIFAGGGSGGHIYPGLAIAAEAARLSDPGRAPACLFVVSDRAIDAKVMGSTQLPWEPSPAKPMIARPAGMIRFVRGWVAATRHAKGVLSRSRSGGVHVVAMGGFVAAPFVRAAKQSGVGVTMVNLDAVPGKANRYIARHANRIFTAARVPTEHREGKEWIEVPPIVRSSVRASLSREECRRALGLDPERPVLMVTGGSQGLRSLNDFVAGFVASDLGKRTLARERWQVLHQTGRGFDEQIRATYGAAGITATVAPFTDQMGLWYGAADLVVCTAGAGNIAEIWMSQTPAMLLPYPHHKDEHQKFNAAPLAECGGAVVCRDHIDPTMNLERNGPELETLLSDPGRREGMRANLAKLGPADGAARIARALLDAIARGS